MLVNRTNKTDSLSEYVLVGIFRLTIKQILIKMYLTKIIKIAKRYINKELIILTQC